MEIQKRCLKMNANSMHIDVKSMQIHANLIKNDVNYDAIHRFQCTLMRTRWNLNRSSFEFTANWLELLCNSCNFMQLEWICMHFPSDLSHKLSEFGSSFNHFSLFCHPTLAFSIHLDAFCIHLLVFNIHLDAFSIQLLCFRSL